MATDLETDVLNLVSDKSGWVPVSIKNGVQIALKPSPHFPGNMFKFTCHLDLPCSYLFDVMRPSHTTEERLSWDNSIAHYEKIRPVTNDIFVTRILTKPVLFGAISSREFVDLLAIKTYDDCAHNPDYGKTHWIFGKSVEDLNYPVTAKHVRATSHPLGYGVAEDRLDSNKSYLELFVNTDVGGSLPRTLVERALPSQQLLYIDTVVKEAKRRMKAGSPFK